MGKNVIDISTPQEGMLQKVKTVAMINGIKANTYQQQIEIAIEWAARLIESSDDETFEAITGRVKKL
jgi:hypothetical protein